MSHPLMCRPTIRPVGVMVALGVAASSVTGHAQFPSDRSRTPGTRAEVTAFVDVHVVPMDTERVLANQTVVVQNGRITALGPSGKVKVPAGAARIEGRGKYLLPGLADMHVHLHPAFYAADTSGRYDFRAPHDTTLADHWLFLFLANGVTTVRNMDYMPDGGRSLRLRARAAAGELLSPRIYTAGAWAGRDVHRVARESVATYLPAYKAAGYDFVKVRDESPKLFDSVAAVARRLGLPIAGHLISGAPIDYALKSGRASHYASLEHLIGYYSRGPNVWAGEEKIPMLAAETRRAGLWNMPHMTLFEVRAGEVQPLTWPELRYVTMPAFRNAMAHMTQMNRAQVLDTTDAELHIRRQVVKALQDSGAGLLLGSDTPLLPLVPGFAVHHELAALVRAGLTPYEALAMATKNVGAFSRLQPATPLAETGTIAVGHLADLVLLDANPLDDVRHAARPAGVMAAGRWLTREAIDRRLAVLPYWKFPGPEVEELALLRQGITLTAAQELMFASLLATHRTEWRALVDSLRSGPRDRAIVLDSVGSARLFALAARQFGAYRRTVLTPEQQKVFDTNARAWLTSYRRQGYAIAIPGVAP